MTTSLLIALLQLAAGFILLIWSADRLVAGASALARNFGISPLIVGLTIVGFGTSAPEMLVSAIASLEGQPSLAVGNAIGSNIANIGLILGLTGMIYPLTVERGTLKREFPILAAIMLVSLAVMSNLYLSRLDGLVLACGLALLIGAMVVLGLARGEKDPLASSLAENVPEGMPMGRAALWTVVGLVVLPVSAHILVSGAVTLATIIGVSEAVIGLTVVALGTSLPELAAAAASALKKEDDLAIGNIMGSNMFNLLGVLGIAALVHPLVIEPILLYRDVAVMFAITLGLFALIWRRRGPGLITRPAAALLFVAFLGYQAVVITTAVAG
ncbi:MAG: calcium/sodium antiporter [Wenzhouxiangella sp.]